MIESPGKDEEKRKIDEIFSKIDGINPKIDYIIPYVQWHIKHYWGIRKAISERRELLAKKKDAVKGVQGGMVPDPTASTAIANLTPIHRVIVDGETVIMPELWVKAVDRGFLLCGEDTQNLVKENLWRGRTVRNICSVEGIDKKTFLRKRLLAIFSVAMVAEKLGAGMFTV